MAQAIDGHHATPGELVSAQVSSEKFLMGTDCADTYFLVDHIHSAEAVEADLIETLFTRLVDGVETGAWVLFFTAVKRARLCGLSLQVPCSWQFWGRSWDNFLWDLLLGLELFLRRPRTHFLVVIVVCVVNLVAIVVVLDMVWERRERIQVVLALSQQARQEEQEEAGSSHGRGVRRQWSVEGSCWGLCAVL